MLSKLQEVFFILSTQQMRIEQQNLSSQLVSTNKILKTFPPGKLICSRNGKQFKWYCSDGKHKTYIPKKNRDLAEKLAIKKYLSFQQEELLRKKRAVDSYLYHYPDTLKSEKLLSETSELHSLLSPYFKTEDEELSQWMNEPYNTNQQFPEHLIHKTISGNLVRSKSEVLIDSVLHSNKIPFRYECELILGDSIFYPDFTILHPRTREIYYWEHHGCMDDPEYCHKAFRKQQIYTSYGIIPGIQLITTYETKEHPLTLDLINAIVDYYFL